MTECNVENRTIFCDDNLNILQGMNSECIDLIYLDPPFNKNKKFTAPIGTSAEGASFKDIFREDDIKEEWLLTIQEDQPELFHYLNGIRGGVNPIISLILRIWLFGFLSVIECSNLPAVFTCTAIQR